MSRACNPDNIVLIGFMGAGKSTIGAELARLCGWRLIDLDHFIVQRQGCSIPEIFSREGEAAFRDYEAAALAALEGVSQTVIATGGGIVGRPDNWPAMRRLGTVVYLRAGWETLFRRLGDGAGRPLAEKSRDDAERLRQLWQSRVSLYEQADLVVDSGAGSPQAVARRILVRLQRETEHEC